MVEVEDEAAAATEDVTDDVATAVELDATEEALTAETEETAAKELVAATLVATEEADAVAELWEGVTPPQPAGAS